jgi:hypothetical protein
MTHESPPANTILVGRGETIRRMPDADWKAALAAVPGRFVDRLAFMTKEHHLVRNYAVRELPRAHGLPIPVDRVAAALDLPLPRVRSIVEELERHLFFLVRNPAGEISWAFPVTAEPTPHRLQFSTGERAHGA